MDGGVTGPESVASRYRLLDYVPYGVCVLRQDCSVAFWNAQLGAWTGVSAREIRNQTISEFFPRCGVKPLRDQLNTVFHGGATFVHPPEGHALPFPDAEKKGCDLSGVARVTPIPGDQAGETYALIIVEKGPETSVAVAPAQEMPDVVDRCQLLETEKEQLLSHMHQMQHFESLGVIAGGIAHDFNNYLSVIMGNADVISLEAEGQQVLMHCCGQIQKAVLRASDLVAQVLAYSGGGKIVLDSIELSRLVARMRPLLESAVGREVDITYNLAPHLAEISGDADQFRQVLCNLVAGAAEALGAAGGNIWVETGTLQASQAYVDALFPKDFMSPGELVYLEVRDNAPGFSADIVAKLFDPAHVGELGDRALGLAASLGVVRAHSGGVRVSSEPHSGTAVRIHFPALSEELLAVADEHRVGGLLDARPGRARILLVDDEEMVRALGEVVLEQHGYSVVTASDGDEAISAFETHEEDLSLVLLDMSMPKRDGYEVARLMRAIRADVPIVICSGYAGVDARSRFATLQVDGFLQKPYHVDELMSTVERMLRRYHD